METSNYLQVMEDSLIKKIEILERIVALNEEQETVLSMEDFSEDDFRENAEKKSECIEEIYSLDEGFQSLYNRVKQELEHNGKEYSDKVKDLQDRIRTITELSVKIEAQESRNKSQAEKRFNEMRQDINNAKRSASMAKTYYQNMNKISYEPQFMDKKN